MPLLKIKNLELRIKNLPSAESQRNWKLKIENWKLAFGRDIKKLKIEARSPTDASLLAIGSLSLGEVLTEQSEDEN